MSRKRKWTKGKPSGLQFTMRIYLPELPDFPITVEVAFERVCWLARLHFAGWQVMPIVNRVEVTYSKASDAKAAAIEMADTTDAVRQWVYSVIQHDMRAREVMRRKMGDEFVDKIMSVPLNITRADGGVVEI